MSAPVGSRPSDPPLIDGSVTKWWSHKTDARNGAKAIGWPVNSVWGVMTRFQYGWALKHTHGGFLTKADYCALLADRQRCNSTPSTQEASNA